MKCNTIQHFLALLTNRLLFVICLFGSTATLADQTSAPVLLYHHVSSQTPASTSVSQKVFAEHMRYINNHHTVLPLKEIVEATQNGKSLPDDALAITFDDGYANILENAHPVLQKYEFPYTIFINPDTIGQRADQLSWAQVQKMAQENVSFANHTMGHLHMLNRNQNESDEQWLERVWNNVQEAQDILTSRLDNVDNYLAYPFGEFNEALALKVEEAGYIGFGQHSGAIGPHANFAALPRFPAAGPYANLKSLKTKMNSLALPVTDSSVSDPHITDTRPPHEVTLNVETDDVRLSQVACYFQGQAIAVTTSNNAVTFTVEKSLPTGRSRVNCTAPSQSRPEKYYWYSQPFFVADENGQFPD
ncbi:polysaccharide deacetylase family protein [Salinimonas chungwhensis]|uniref:polysaccharide deacetylase family protein n=1 Tax=Salinimonas chungwhensis TaxID=265425 RepID=UPI0003A3B123|nr:polysaccharide deacetylase family protein [Salinimonas chungwhensis]